MQDINTILELLKTDPSLMTVDKDAFILASQLLDVAESNVETNDSNQAIDAFEQIRNINKSSIDLVESFSSRLSTIGMVAYSVKNFLTAEKTFRMLAETCGTTAKNNYAYMIRRHEIAHITDRDHLIALKLLNDGVKEGEAFSLVNTALVFALMLGDNESWHLADSIFEKLSPLGGALVESWWKDVAEAGDIEGDLVLFFLLRYGLIDDSETAPIKSIARRLTKNLSAFPKWLAEDYALETLDDVVECIEDPDFDSILEEFLEKMPSSRKSVDEMLEIVSAWDLWPVYYKLLTDCETFLTLEEHAKLKTDYKEKFSIPLPDEGE